MSAILGIQATKEAEATAAREAQLRAEAEVQLGIRGDVYFNKLLVNILWLVNNYG